MCRYPSIAFYIETLSYGGAERVTVYLAEYFSANGFKTFIITNEKKEKEYILPNNVQRINLNAKDLKSKVKSLRYYLKENKLDILLTMNTYLTPISFFSAFNLSTKVIVSERNSPQNFHGKKMTKLTSEYLLKFVDGYVFQTEEVKSYYSKLQGKKMVIPNPLLNENIPQPYIGNRKNRIVSVGRLHKQKNHEFLIKSFAEVNKKYPEYELVIFGEGEERTNLERIIAQLNLVDKVKLPGSHKDIMNKINDASLFVLSSDFEGMPNALIEAMAIGLPVISTDCSGGGPRELIDNNINGILVGVGNEKEMVASIEKMLSDKDFKNKLSANALLIREELDSNKIGAKWMTFCKEVLESN